MARISYCYKCKGDEEFIPEAEGREIPVYKCRMYRCSKCRLLVGQVYIDNHAYQESLREQDVKNLIKKLTEDARQIGRS